MVLGIYYKNWRVFSTQVAVILFSTFISKHLSAGVLTTGYKFHVVPLMWYLYFATNRCWAKKIIGFWFILVVGSQCICYGSKSPWQCAEFFLFP